MDCSHSVYGVAPHDTQIGHSDFLYVTLLYDGKILEFSDVSGVLFSHFLEPDEVNQVNNFEMAREKSSEKIHAPFFQRLGENGVVGVGETSVNDIPGLFVLESLLVDEDAQQLNNSQSRVCVIELEGALLRDLLKVRVDLLEAAHHVPYRGRHQQVLLLESEFLARQSAVVRVQHARDELGLLTFLQRAEIVARIERAEVKLVVRQTAP